MTALSVEAVTVAYGGRVALDDVSLGIDEGSVTGLIGPNGAGKTTLLNVVTGMVSPDRGTVRLAGADIGALSTHQRARAGLTGTFQRLEIFGSLTVRANIVVAAHIRNRWAWGRHGRGDADLAADAVMEMLGLDAVAGEPAAAVPTGLARLVELARALMTRPRVLLLDEPAGGLSERETAELARVLERLASGGMTVMLVEHDMGFVMGACDRIHVLDRGSLIASGPPEEIQRDPAVVSAYLGTGSGTP